MSTPSYITFCIACYACVTMACDERPVEPSNKPPTVTRLVSAGGRTSCYLASDGQLYCWGSNVYGQLGIGRADTDPHRVPERVSTPLRFTDASVGSNFVCALTDAGEAYCWGSNEWGQLGAATSERCAVRLVPCSMLPERVSGDLKFRLIRAGTFDSACGITTDNRAFCWGLNASGQLGDGTTINRANATPVTGGFQFSDLDVGSDYACGITNENVAYCWGANGSGELGIAPRNRPGVPIYSEPVPVRVTGDRSFRAISAGSDHTCAITPTDDAYCWGSGQWIGAITAEQTSPPRLVEGEFQSSEITLSEAHTCVIAQGGAAYCWGTNTQGKLGIGSTSSATLPARVGGGALFTSIALGQHHSCAVESGGQVYCWGLNSSGELGVGSTATTATSPIPVVNLPRN